MRILPLVMLFGCAQTETVPWNFTAQNIIGVAVADAEVCTESACAVSGADGLMQLDLPVGESVLTIDHEGVRSLQFLSIDDVAPAPNRIIIINDVLWNMVVAELPEIDPALGLVLVSNVFQKGHANELSVAGDGPHYINSTFTGIDEEATVTTNAGLSIFVNVALGDGEATYSPPTGQSCQNSPWNWPSDQPMQSRFEVEPGVLSRTELDCSQ